MKRISSKVSQLITNFIIVKKMNESKYSYFLLIGLVLFLNKILSLYYKVFIFNGIKFFSLFDSSITAKGIYYYQFYSLISFSNIFFFIPICLITGWLFIFRKKISWSSFNFHQNVHYFVFFIALFIFWNLSTYEYNYFFNQAFYIDRLLLLLLLFGVWRSPIFLPLFLGITWLSIAQFSHPLGNNSITDKKIAFEILNLFIAILIIKPLFQKKVTITFFVILFALIGANYFIPAITKVQISPNFIDWFLENELWIHYVHSLEKGWLSFISTEWKTGLREIYFSTNHFMLLTTLLIELAALFLLFKKRFTILLLVLFCFFHLMVFAESGIFFWKWILFNIVLIIILFYSNKKFADHLFNKTNRIIFLVLILFSTFLFNPVRLGWWDDRYHHEFNYYAVSDEGDKVQISGNKLQPYAQTFTFHRLSYLIPDSVSTINSFSNYNRFATFKGYSKVDFEDYVDSNDTKTFNKPKEEIFQDFIKTYFSNYNKRQGKPIFLTHFKAPDHIFTSKFIGADLPNKVDKFIVEYHSWFIDNSNQKKSIVNTEIISININ